MKLTSFNQTIPNTASTALGSSALAAIGMDISEPSSDCAAITAASDVLFNVPIKSLALAETLVFAVAVLCCAMSPVRGALAEFDMVALLIAAVSAMLSNSEFVAAFDDVSAATPVFEAFTVPVA